MNNILIYDSNGVTKIICYDASFEDIEKELKKYF